MKKIPYNYAKRILYKVIRQTGKTNQLEQQSDIFLFQVSHQGT
jgi:hypothetical protein